MRAARTGRVSNVTLSTASGCALRADQGQGPVIRRRLIDFAMAVMRTVDNALHLALLLDLMTTTPMYHVIDVAVILNVFKLCAREITYGRVGRG